MNSVHQVEIEAGREEGSVRVIAVTKYSDSAVTRQFAENGLLDLAENRAELLLQKQADLSDLTAVRWHLIGTLQRRKVKEIINSIDTFHALDSLPLAQEISKRAKHPISCLIEVNVSGELSKHGFKSSELEGVLAQISQLPNVLITGLMTMAPIDADDAELTHIFRTTRELRDQIKALDLVNCPCTELSMGMTRDYKIAIKEGATMVRIGRDFLNDD
ncbi:MAG: YggS family pyridoxal phosphate-dependent enzyme [Streptococcaceae bacterium]|nr:YggS family pyridoxal phosphate-dependent enzyme [Streptococcaceae bacterium]